MTVEVDRFRRECYRRGAELAGLLGDWTAGPGPLYRKLADALARAAEEGALRAGERLPAERELATALAVSRATVVGAYDELRARDVVERRQGSGTRVRRGRRPPRSDGRVRGGQAGRIFQRLIDGPGPLISLACAAEGGAGEVADALDEVAAHDIGALLGTHGYYPRGLPALREAIAEYHSARGLPTHPDEVLVTTGAHQALVLVAEVYLRRSATVVVESPSWPACLDVFRAQGAELVPVPLDGEGIDPRPLAAALAEHEPALLYVMPTYHNPTGLMTSEARRRRVVELAAKWDVPVLEDNAYAGRALAPDAVDLPPLAAYAPPEAEVVTVESLGKAVWGGLRVGWVRAPVELIERCARRKALADLGTPVIDQAVAARLVPRMGEISRRRAVDQRERFALLERLLRERLPEWTWRRPDGGSSLWVALPGESADVFAQLALRHGVEVIPGSAMDPTGAHDNHLRIPFTHPPEVLAEVVDRLARAWTELRRHGPRDVPRLHPIV
ncbi:DNA-binding transcriptional regulator, MocR family, contains an aminotransferase domain [Amycolatopsis arida]|uniref:DNA-binding transcriptional regulator, MocR family, contains an aminotransferase domain n=1 Tax=Amycolatopsis arida TaxID=587909 RepID=A0A1I5YYN1_9PSEU|nr:PLP-dependent aminotransferase family protein [Amycolatopsis arida]TDX89975.1 DNA-binding transcriptional MocR family regulator [Amycolatopsis arida]SFQ49220.1 DNA-binding transcriptional regulator, MocR family, contains an aminotransferase domain [Amycolatopsis arida]